VRTRKRSVAVCLRELGYRVIEAHDGPSFHCAIRDVACAFWKGRAARRLPFSGRSKRL
jgi:hypothetical protein